MRNGNRFCFSASVFLGTATIVASVAPTADAQTTRSAVSQSILKANIVRGYVTLYVNGQNLGTVGKQDITIAAASGIKNLPINTYVRPGANTLKIVWQGSKAPIGGVSIGYAPPGAAMRRLADVQLNPINARGSGSRNIVFYLPKSGTNQSVGADVPATGTVAPGSHANQTLLIANIVNGETVNVMVNGKKAGIFTGGYVPLDVSDYVRSGSNDVTLSWNGGIPMGEIKVSYAAQPSKFRTLSSVALNQMTVKQGTKTRTVSFNMP